MDSKFTLSNKLSFSSGPIHFNFNTAIIAGACRSGKTSLGNLLGTCANIENVEEPWTAKILPLMSGLNLVNDSIGKEMFLVYITELYIETIFLRRANFRPQDLSCIWAQKDHEEVYSRLTELKSREDIKKYTTKNNPLLLLNLTEVVPFLDFLFDSMPKTKLIYVIRDGKDVALDCLDKGWFSDNQLLSPVKALPYQKYRIKNKIWHLPWWINLGDEDLFISYTEYERCIYYWCQTVESGANFVNEMINKGSCYKVYYDDLMKKPLHTVKLVTEFLDSKMTPKTEYAIAKLKLRVFKNLNQEIITDINLKNRYLRTQDKLCS
jgi:hypothetical protein